MKVQIVNKSTNPLPAYQTEGSVGFDLMSTELMMVFPKSRTLIPTGIYIAIPDGFEGQVRPRSGLAIREGLTVLNTPGTIDSDYRGEIKVIVYNTGESTITINPGDRIAQLVISPIQKVELEEVEELDSTERGEGGFGSTGINHVEESDTVELLDIYEDSIPFNYVEEQEDF